MIVEVRPLDKPKWHGLKGAENFGSPTVLSVLVDGKTKRYATGLSPELQEEYEKMLKIDLSDKVHPLEPHPYWSTKPAKIELPFHTIFFDTSIPTEDIKYHNLKASKFVANSMREYEDGMWPNATHVIFSEEEEAKMAYSKKEVYYQAIAEAVKLSKDEKIDAILILSNLNLRGRSDDMVNMKLDEALEAEPKKFLTFAKADKKRRGLKALILEAVHRNVLTKEGQSIYYYGDRIGLDMEEAIDYLSKDDNQKALVHIREKLVA